MRYTCSIYSQAGLFATTSPKADPDGDSPVVRVVVSGSSLREAAARAYVRCVGRQRAKWMRDHGKSPAAVVAQETNRRAIAASLRKVTRRFGECYEMDNLTAVWSIKVEPTAQPRRLRLPHLRLYHLSRSSVPN